MNPEHDGQEVVEVETDDSIFDALEPAEEVEVLGTRPAGDAMSRVIDELIKIGEEAEEVQEPEVVEPPKSKWETLGLSPANAAIANIFDETISDEPILSSTLKGRAERLLNAKTIEELADLSNSRIESIAGDMQRALQHHHSRMNDFGSRMKRVIPIEVESDFI